MTDRPNDELSRLMNELQHRELPSNTRIELSRARAHAVSRVEQAKPTLSFAPAATFASALVLAMVFSLQSRGIDSPPAVSADIHEIEFVYAPTDADIAADVDFYEWLGKQSDAG